MTTAWEILTSNSTLESGTAWEHLNAQGGGGSGEPAGYTVLADGMEVFVAVSDLSVSIEQPSLSADITHLEIDAEILNPSISATVAAIELSVEIDNG